MFGYEDLKAEINVTKTTVECPVRGCQEKVQRQRKFFKAKQQFQCPQHKIYISPSTFEYPSELDNLLWRETDDLEMLRAIRGKKRESRMARDNSEDAVTWNVFRYLERADLVAPFLSSLISSPVENPQVVYWSYSRREGGVCLKLAEARQEFGEGPLRGSEPDLIVVSEGALFWIEAKLTASNKPDPPNKEERKEYLTGGNNWYMRVLKSDYDTVAIKSKKYQLMRFWLLGSWMAAQMNRDYYLVNLVRVEREGEIESEFGQHINMSKHRRFLRCTWEEIHKYVLENARATEKKDVLLRYFQNKTVGYEPKRRDRRELQRAFKLTMEE